MGANTTTADQPQEKHHVGHANHHPQGREPRGPGNMTTGNIATGNSPLKIKLFYRTVDLLT